MEEALARLLAAGADAPAVAAQGCALWRRAAAALLPIIGRQGVAALFRRSLLQARADWPLLAGVHDAAAEPLDFSGLLDALALATPADAARAQVALFDAFCTLLASLIGSALTDRLLLPVWEPTSTDRATRGHRQ
ncbi:hypothetical protein [Derxia lacustris]|uniref:hypothetical protein n=1 Tax=Derxia lacustris TaxID=764842 RepID=UPI000A17323A|nr:hypothetical protein [Derxia lacustris]